MLDSFYGIVCLTNTLFHAYAILSCKKLPLMQSQHTLDVIEGFMSRMG